MANFYSAAETLKLKYYISQLEMFNPHTAK